jgi:hypothetical protein
MRSSNFAIDKIIPAALWPTQPLTEMGTSDFPEEPDNSTAICEPIV